jgi:hypothetical protein
MKDSTQSRQRQEARRAQRREKQINLPAAVRVVAIFVAAIFIAGTPSTPQKNASHFYLGFDRNIYPGDAAMPILRKTFAFSSYWLSPPPGEKINTWSGKRELLRSLDFGYLVLFRGPQIRELEKIWSELPSNRSAALQETRAEKKATLDARQAAASARKEGFPAHTVIFLDIEEGGRLPSVYHAYLRAWVDELALAGYRAGVYCSGMPVSEDHGATIKTADDIHDKMGKRDILYWIYNDACPPSPGCAFPQDPPSPVKSGISYASVWQFAQSPRRKEFTARCPAKYAADGNCYAPGDSKHAWFLDVNSARSSDPSGGAR